MKNEIHMFERDDIEILNAKSKHTFPLHSHESFCVGIVMEGIVTFCIDGIEKELHKNDVYIIPSNTGVTISSLEEYEYTTICIKHHNRDELLKYDVADYFPANIGTSELLALCELYKEGLDCAEFICGVILVLSNVLIEKDLAEEQSQLDYIIEAKQYIRSRLDEPFNLDDLSEYVHISKYYLIRNFKKSTGVTPNQFYIQSKMYEIKKAIKENRKETQVAAELSYADQAHMCKQFKKQMGITIQDYKKNYKHL